MAGSLKRLQAKYEGYILLTCSRETSRRYSGALENFFRRFSDYNEPDEFTRADIEDFKVYRLKDKVKPSTINFEVQVIKAFWNWLMKQDLIAYNPTSTVKRLKEKEAPKQSLSEPEQMRLYETSAATGNPFDRLLVSLALSTGLRAATLVALTNEEVDREVGALRISADKMKAGRNHEIPLRQEIVDLIPNKEGRIFEGYAKTAPQLCYRFNHLLRRSGLVLRGLRTARRSFATTLLRNGADLGLVQNLLAHRNIQTTSRYLTQADSKTARAALDRLPQLPGLTPPSEVKPGT